MGPSAVHRGTGWRATGVPLGDHTACTRSHTWAMATLPPVRALGERAHLLLPVSDLPTFFTYQGALIPRIRRYSSRSCIPEILA